MYQDAYPEDAGVNRAFQDYSSVYEGRVPSVDVAVNLADEFRRVGVAYDVVRIDPANEPPADRPLGQLGFDVTVGGGYSFLSWGLHWNGLVALPPMPHGPLVRLIEAHFRPLLNASGLFDDWGDARFFLDVVLAESELAPGTWEGPEEVPFFEVVRLTLIRAG